MKDNFTEINIMPLVDIMLVLIVIILMTASFMTTGRLHVDLPEARFSQTVSRNCLHLEMQRDGSMIFEGHPVTPGTLSDLLIGKNREDEILISADKDITLQPFVHVVDQLKQAGFHRISLQTKK